MCECVRLSLILTQCFQHGRKSHRKIALNALSWYQLSTTFPLISKGENAAGELIHLREDSTEVLQGSKLATL